jgi:hypothetical protein
MIHKIQIRPGRVADRRHEENLQRKTSPISPKGRWGFAYSDLTHLWFLDLSNFEYCLLYAVFCFDISDLI